MGCLKWDLVTVTDHKKQVLVMRQISFRWPKEWASTATASTINESSAIKLVLLDDHS